MIGGPSGKTARRHKHRPCQNIVFLGGIPLDASRNDILEYLLQFDSVLGLEMAVDKKTRKNKGFAKANLKTSEGIDRMLSVQNHVLKGLTIGVKRWTNKVDYLKKKDEVSRRKLFVRHDSSITEQDLYEHFSQFGQLELLDYKVNSKTGFPRNIAYVVYSTEEEAQWAIQYGSYENADKYITCTLTTPSFILSKPLVPKKSKTQVTFPSEFTATFKKKPVISSPALTQTVEVSSPKPSGPDLSGSIVKFSSGPQNMDILRQTSIVLEEPSFSSQIENVKSLKQMSRSRIPSVSQKNALQQGKKIDSATIQTTQSIGGAGLVGTRSKLASIQGILKMSSISKTHQFLDPYEHSTKPTSKHYKPSSKTADTELVSNLRFRVGPRIM